MASVCIICRKNKAGEPVGEDAVISLIRKVKRALGIEAGNRLVVCRGCMEEHLKRRRAFEKSLVQYTSLGVILFVLLALIGRTLAALGIGLALALLIVALAVATNYHPALKRRRA